MKRLFETTDSGYSWSHRKTYYLCESQEEYNALLEEYKDHKNHYNAYKQVSLNVNIHCRPHTEVSDGYAVHGGHTLDAKGIEIKYNSSGLSTDYSSFEYYIAPDSITKNEQVKTEEWWV